jgi:chromosomal replication initiator protein
VFFGGRDHSTVIHAVKTVKEKISKTDKTRKQVDMIKQELDFSLI